MLPKLIKVYLKGNCGQHKDLDIPLDTTIRHGVGR